MKRTSKNFVILCALNFLLFTIIALLTAPTIAAYSAEDSNVALTLGVAAGILGGAGGIAFAITGSAAISAITEKPEVFIRAFMIVSLAEAVAIYGLLLGILVIGGMG